MDSRIEYLIRWQSRNFPPLSTRQTPNQEGPGRSDRMRRREERAGLVEEISVRPGDSVIEQACSICDSTSSCFCSCCESHHLFSSLLFSFVALSPPAHLSPVHSFPQHPSPSFSLLPCFLPPVIPQSVATTETEQPLPPMETIGIRGRLSSRGMSWNAVSHASSLIA